MEIKTFLAWLLALIPHSLLLLFPSREIREIVVSALWPYPCYLKTDISIAREFPNEKISFLIKSAQLMISLFNKSDQKSESSDFVIIFE